MAWAVWAAVRSLLDPFSSLRGVLTHLTAGGDFGGIDFSKLGAGAGLDALGGMGGADEDDDDDDDDMPALEGEDAADSKKPAAEAPKAEASK